MAGQDDDFFDEKDDDASDEGQDEGEDFGEENPFEEDQAPSRGGKKAKGDEDFDDDEDGGEYYDDEESEKKQSRPVAVVRENRFIKFTGKILPLARDEKGAVSQLKIENIDDKKVYVVEMNNIGKELVRRCFHEFFVTGEVVTRSGVDNLIIIKSYL